MAWGREEQVSFLRVYCSTAVVRDRGSFRQLGQTSLVSDEAGQKEFGAGFLVVSAASRPAGKPGRMLQRRTTCLDRGYRELARYYPLARAQGKVQHWAGTLEANSANRS